AHHVWILHLSERNRLPATTALALALLRCRSLGRGFRDWVGCTLLPRGEFFQHGGELIGGQRAELLRRFQIRYKPGSHSIAHDSGACEQRAPSERGASADARQFLELFSDFGGRCLLQTKLTEQQL